MSAYQPDGPSPLSTASITRSSTSPGVRTNSPPRMSAYDGSTSQANNFPPRKMNSPPRVSKLQTQNHL
jgi:hypothetical protein